MNITSTPIMYSTNYQNRNNTAPAFKALQPQTVAKQVAKKPNIAQKIYGFFTLARHEAIEKVQDGYVYTIKKNKSKMVSQKYKMWSRKPEAVIEDNYVTKLRKKTVFNSDKTTDIEIRDMSDPNYVVSVGYKGVKDAGNYDGVVSINYLGEKYDITPEKRDELIIGYSDYINKNILPSDVMARRTVGEFTEILDRYNKSPQLVARCILESPKSIDTQLGKVRHCLPYGIEDIATKMRNS